MSARRRIELDILCPSCGATGEAHVSENDDPDAAFSVEEYPPGFSEDKRAASRHETLVACRCGQVFYLL